MNPMVTENQTSTIHIENLERQVHSILLKSSNYMGGGELKDEEKRAKITRKLLTKWQ